eukprot:gene451-538_t
MAGHCLTTSTRLSFHTFLDRCGSVLAFARKCLIVLASILGFAASAGSVTMAHAISFAISLALLSNLSQYHFHKCCQRRRDLGHWHRFGPFYLTALAVPLATVDILRHILVDNGIWKMSDRWSPAAYRPGCTQMSMKCLNLNGWFFVVFCTYSGYILLMIGTIWCAELHIKIRDAWRSMRGGPSSN